MAEYVPAALRRQLRDLAGDRCEYCLYPEVLAEVRHEPDHIIALQHNGTTTLACFSSNRHKGSNPGSIDPETGVLTRFFNPRRDVWRDHFYFDAGRINPLTAIGRVTAAILQFNAPQRIVKRQRAIELGLIRIE